MKRFALLLVLLLALPLSAAEYKPIVLDSSYNHDKFGTQPVDISREFRAYTVSFDSADDDDGDEIADVWGIPPGCDVSAIRVRCARPPANGFYPFRI